MNKSGRCRRLRPIRRWVLGLLMGVVMLPAARRVETGFSRPDSPPVEAGALRNTGAYLVEQGLASGNMARVFSLRQTDPR
jgi:hypothetical protein